MKVGLGLLAVLAVVIPSVVFFTRSDKVQVDLTVVLKDVDLTDKSLTFFLDDESVPAEALAKPVELKPGVHIFTVKRGKVIVKRVEIRVGGGKEPGIKVEDITPSPPPPPPPPSDRELAEWFLRNDFAVLPATGDQLPTNDDELMRVGQWVTRRDDLPAGPFKLIGLGHRQPGQSVRREAIQRLGEARNLRWLGFHGCPEFDDAGLAAVAQCTEMIWIRAEITKVTDAGLKHLAGMKKLQRLELGFTAVTGAGLADMPDAPLTWLFLNNAGSGTPESVRAICRFKRLQLLWVGSDTLGDAEARTLFRSLPELREANIGYARLTDDGLDAVPEAKHLAGLYLRNTRVTGDGLKHLARAAGLQSLEIDYTPVRDAGLAHLRQVPRLSRLRLENTAVTNAGLDHLAGVADLEELHLINTPVTDAGAKQLAGFRNLRRLQLDGSRITDEVLKHLGGCPTLQGLWVRNTAVTNAGLEHLKKVPQLAELGLAKTGVTDAGLEHLTVIRTLRSVDLRDTAVTDDGLRRLKAALPDCQILPEPKAQGGPPADGFVPLFNGKDLTGWKAHPDARTKWVVEDGCLTASGPPGHLFTDRGDYENVRLPGRGQDQRRRQQRAVLPGRVRARVPAGLRGPDQCDPPRPDQDRQPVPGVRPGPDRGAEGPTCRPGGPAPAGASGSRRR